MEQKSNLQSNDMNRLKEIYQKEIAPKIKSEFKLGSNMEVPKLQKIVVNAGIGGFRDNREAVEVFLEEYSSLLGQKPYPRKARLSEAGFKVRKGDIVGYAATLRGDKMWAFFDKLVNVAIPRIRDFNGLKTTAFDGAGNYSIGIPEHVIFPEVNPNTVKGIRSLQVTVVTSSSDQELNKALLTYLGTPFMKGKETLVK